MYRRALRWGLAIGLLLGLLLLGWTVLRQIPSRPRAGPGNAPALAALPALDPAAVQTTLRGLESGKLVVVQCLLDRERLTLTGIWPKAAKYRRRETSLQEAQPYRYELLDAAGQVVFSRGVVLRGYCPEHQAHGEADHLLGGHQLVAHQVPFLAEFPHTPSARLLRLRRLNAQGEVEVVGEIALGG